MSGLAYHSGDHGGAGAQRSTVCAVVSGANARVVRAALENQPGIAVAICDAEKVEPVSFLEENGFDLLLLEPLLADGSDVEEWGEAFQRVGSRAAVIALGADMSPGIVRALLKLRVADIIASPFLPEDLAGACRKALAELRAAHHDAAPSDAADCWGFISAVGGAGATTLAIQSGFEWRKRMRSGGRIAVIDLDFQSSGCAAHLELKANMMLADAGEEPERIDATMVESYASAHEAGVDFYCPPARLTGLEAPAGPAVGRLLDVACQMHQRVVLDLPSGLRPWTMDVLSGCNERFVVTQPTVPALRAARALADAIDETSPQSTAARIILNRYEKQLFGQSVSLSDAARALGRPVFAVVANDYQTARDAVNGGFPLGAVNPGCRIIRDVSKMVDLVGDGAYQRSAA